MIQSSIIESIILGGQAKKGTSFYLGHDNQMCQFRVRIEKVLKVDGETILKLKTYKDYPLGHKYIYRSINELLTIGK